MYEQFRPFILTRNLKDIKVPKDIKDYKVATDIYDAIDEFKTYLSGDKRHARSINSRLKKIREAMDSVFDETNTFLYYNMITTVEDYLIIGAYLGYMAEKDFESVPAIRRNSEGEYDISQTNIHQFRMNIHLMLPASINDGYTYLSRAQLTSKVFTKSMIDEAFTTLKNPNLELGIITTTAKQYIQVGYLYHEYGTNLRIIPLDFKVDEEWIETMFNHVKVIGRI